MYWTKLKYIAPWVLRRMGSRHKWTAARWERTRSCFPQGLEYFFISLDFVFLLWLFESSVVLFSSLLSLCKSSNISTCTSSPVLTKSNKSQYQTFSVSVLRVECFFFWIDCGVSEVLNHYQFPFLHFLRFWVSKKNNLWVNIHPLSLSLFLAFYRFCWKLRTFVLLFLYFSMLFVLVLVFFLFLFGRFFVRIIRFIILWSFVFEELFFPLWKSINQFFHFIIRLCIDDVNLRRQKTNL